MAGSSVLVQRWGSCPAASLPGIIGRNQPSLEGRAFGEAVVCPEPFGGRQLHSIRAKSGSGSADEGSPDVGPRVPTAHPPGILEGVELKEPPSSPNRSEPSPLRTTRHSLLGEPRLFQGVGGERAVFTASASSPTRAP